jgi:hypothetical protein
VEDEGSEEGDEGEEEEDKGEEEEDEDEEMWGSSFRSKSSDVSETDRNLVGDSLSEADSSRGRAGDTVDPQGTRGYFSPRKEQTPTPAPARATTRSVVCPEELQGLAIPRRAEATPEKYLPNR